MSSALSHVAVALLALTVDAAYAQSTASTILQKAFEIEAQQTSFRAQYFYRERAEHRQAAKDLKPGKPNFTHDYEWVYLEGEPYRRLVAVDNAPLLSLHVLD